MTINKFNYEAFALDYLEGNLAPAMVEEMESFLKTHPAIESELSGMMEFVTLEADETIVYEQKESLLKPERVVWLQKRWIRPLMAAASVTLLLMTYFMGYQAGVDKGGETIVVVEENKVNKKEAIKSEMLVATSEIEPAIKKVEKPIKTTEQAAPKTIKQSFIKNRKQLANVIYQPIERPSIVEETIATTTETRNNPTEKIPVLNPKSLTPPMNKATVAEIDRIKATVLTSLVATNLNLVKLSSTTSNTNDLPNVLQADLPLDKAKLAQQLKRKRRFKDLLGKFPVNNLKEALIPSYYREEATGQ
ncbi:MAG: hypothetical protein AB8G86_04735 [Saprospiraceae bacterium]